jgi:hypothetical protein
MKTIEVSKTFFRGYGIASSDAMILNIFLCSKTPMLLTADLEMAQCAVKESKGTKQVFIPDSMMV